MSRKEVFVLLLILVTNLLPKIYRLDYAEGQPIFDEGVYYLPAARAYLEGRDDPNFEHPPLGKILIASGLRIFGDNPLGWRMPAVIFSLLGIVLLFILAKEMFGGSFIPLTSALLLSLDNLYLIHSRLAVPEIFLVVFILASALFLWRYRRNGGFFNLLLLGISYGAAFSTKWTALLLLPMIVIFFYRRSGFKMRFFLDGLFLSTVVFAIYAVSYLPFIQRHSFWAFLVLQETIFGFWRHFGGKFKFTAASYLLNHAFVWIFNPVWNYDVRFVGDRLGLVEAIFNPVIFWLGLAALGRSILDLRQRVDERLIFLVLPVVLNFFPWLFVGRIQYLYYFLFSLPFLCLLLADRLKRIADAVDGSYKVVWVFLTAIFSFLYFFPLSTSLPVSKFYFSPFSAGAVTIVGHQTR